MLDAIVSRERCDVLYSRQKRSINQCTGVESHKTEEDRLAMMDDVSCISERSSSSTVNQKKCRNCDQFSETISRNHQSLPRQCHSNNKLSSQRLHENESIIKSAIGQKCSCFCLRISKNGIDSPTQASSPDRPISVSPSGVSDQIPVIPENSIFSHSIPTGSNSCEKKNERPLESKLDDGSHGSVSPTCDSINHLAASTEDLVGSFLQSLRQDDTCDFSGTQLFLQHLTVARLQREARYHHNRVAALMNEIPPTSLYAQSNNSRVVGHRRISSESREERNSVDPPNRDLLSSCSHYTPGSTEVDHSAITSQPHRDDNLELLRLRRQLAAIDHERAQTTFVLDRFAALLQLRSHEMERVHFPRSGIATTNPQSAIGVPLQRITDTNSNPSSETIASNLMEEGVLQRQQTASGSLLQNQAIDANLGQDLTVSRVLTAE